MNKKKLVLSALAVFMIVAFVSASAFAAVEVTVGTVAPDAGDIGVVVPVTLNDQAPAIRGAQIEIQFDATNLTFQSGQSVDGNWLIDSITSPETGMVRVVLAASGEGIAANTAATLANLTFDVATTAAQQAYALTVLDSSSLADTNNNPIPFIAIDGAINLGGEVDTTAPVITLQGNDPLNVSLNSTYTDPGATATDNVDGTVAVVIDDSQVNTSTLGTYTVTYTATDAAGNEATATRTVNVVNDTTPPVITLEGQNPMTVLVGSTYTDPGATALDTVDGAVDVSVDPSQVNTSTAGQYTVTYTATDAAGNEATATRTVNVVAEQIVGDGDGNGTVDIFDALAAALYDAEMGTPANLDQLDVVCPLGVDINDALQIAKYDAGLVTELTVVTSCP